VPAVQSSRSSRRQIEQPLRPDRPLVYARLSDPILVKRAKDGDSKALSALCERHAARVEKLAAHLLPNSEDARDAAQEALAKLCVRLRQFRGESQFSTWLHRLVVNTCRDVAERQRMRHWHSPWSLTEDRRIASDPDPESCVALAELRHELSQQLASISADQARVVVLKDAFGYSFTEISSAAGIPVGTAKCYAHRGRNSLRARLRSAGA
jgi:RNA polymerase sigma-70 factor, ECF subfamily